MKLIGDKARWSTQKTASKHKQWKKICLWGLPIHRAGGIACTLLCINLKFKILRLFQSQERHHKDTVISLYSVPAGFPLSAWGSRDSGDCLLLTYVGARFLWITCLVPGWRAYCALRASCFPRKMKTNFPVAWTAARFLLEDTWERALSRSLKSLRHLFYPVAFSHVAR